MIALAATMNAALMAAFIARLGAAATCYVFGGARVANITTAPAGAPICVIGLASPAGEINATTGEMVFAATDNLGSNGQITNAINPTWARFFASNGDALFDLDARLSGATDLGQELVLTATALNVGAFIRIVGGGFTAA